MPASASDSAARPCAEDEGARSTRDAIVVSAHVVHRSTATRTKDASNAAPRRAPWTVPGPIGRAMDLRTRYRPERKADRSPGDDYAPPGIPEGGETALEPTPEPTREPKGNPRSASAADLTC